ncbi:hypothetical protein LXL04_023334 [Taraxacum kok-saghyz]
MLSTAAPRDKVTNITKYFLYRFFEVDDAVEVNGRAEDKGLCFYATTILSLSETEVEVRYGDLKTEDGRPIIENGDAVIVWVRDRWWIGRFVTRVGRSDAMCLVLKPGGEETIYCKCKHVRAHYIWQLIESLSMWSYTKLIRDIQ